ncbi:hypothetical protein [Hymenobacter koreensis]|uniref:Cyclophilin-like domain-containing protein n=1 Tax=Hymenobacter koreensis TaxID=1084523 RepID=A0ABP8IV82_9BACT
MRNFYLKLVGLVALLGLMTTLAFRPAAAPAAGGTVALKLNGKAYSLVPTSRYLTMGTANIHANLGAGDVSLAFYLPDNLKLPLRLTLGDAMASTSVIYTPDNAQAGKFFYWSSKGTLTVTRYDAATRTVSGTFSCTGQLRKNLKDVPGSTVQLTDGRFDNVQLVK